MEKGIKENAEAEKAKAEAEKAKADKKKEADESNAKKASREVYDEKMTEYRWNRKSLIIFVNVFKNSGREKSSKSIRKRNRLVNSSKSIRKRNRRIRHTFISLMEASGLDELCTHYFEEITPVKSKEKKVLKSFQKKKVIKMVKKEIRKRIVKVKNILARLNNLRKHVFTDLTNSIRKRNLENHACMSKENTVEQATKSLTKCILHPPTKCVLVRCEYGDNNTVVIDINPLHVNMHTLQEKIYEKTGVKIKDQRLYFGSRPFSENKLPQLLLEQDPTLHLSLRLSGGAKDNDEKSDSESNSDDEDGNSSTTSNVQKIDNTIDNNNNEVVLTSNAQTPTREKMHRTHSSGLEVTEHKKLPAS